MPSGIIEAFRAEFQALRSLAERAAAQVDEGRWFAGLDADANSIALLMKHVGGNLRSRWTDALTTDGEKPDRQREREFVQEASDTRPGVEATWSAGWTALFTTLESLREDDLFRTVSIRGERVTLIRALTRSLAHTAGHVHQIVLLAKHWCGPEWHTLSIPKGGRQPGV
jgi:hypothetical protein